jgi:hypothetical protein
MEELLKSSKFVDVSAEAVISAASVALTLGSTYIVYVTAPFALALKDAASASNASNDYSVFCTTWYEDTVGRLSDADIANLLRLADFMLLTRQSCEPLVSVTAQRELRARPREGLKRASERRLFSDMPQHEAAVAYRVRRVRLPKKSTAWLKHDNTERSEAGEAALWGQLATLQQAQSQGLTWDATKVSFQMSEPTCVRRSSPQHSCYAAGMYRGHW